MESLILLIVVVAVYEFIDLSSFNDFVAID